MLIMEKISKIIVANNKNRKISDKSNKLVNSSVTLVAIIINAFEKILGNVIEEFIIYTVLLLILKVPWEKLPAFQ